MTDKNPNCTDWQVKVRCYDSDSEQGWTESTENIPEGDFCVQMPGFENQPLGRPVDANLAVNLIKDFYTAITSAYGPVDDKELDDLEADALRGLYRQARAFLNMLTNINYGMTIDKDFALKILSQPRCEGIRSYLCYKKDDAEAPVSLVNLGVDSDGFDLNYDKKDTVVYSTGEVMQTVLPPLNNAPAIQTVEMRSLAGEYATPPYTIELANLFENKHITEQNQDFYSRFILLNAATGNKALIDSIVR